MAFLAALLSISLRPSYKKAFNPSARFNVYSAAVTKALFPVNQEVSIHLKNSSMIGFEYFWRFLRRLLGDSFLKDFSSRYNLSQYFTPIRLFLLSTFNQ